MRLQRLFSYGPDCISPKEAARWTSRDSRLGRARFQECPAHPDTALRWARDADIAWQPHKGAAWRIHGPSWAALVLGRSDLIADIKADRTSDDVRELYAELGLRLEQEQAA